MIRAAVGTASILGLANLKMDTPPTTAHLMTPGRCIFDCKFCTQAKSSNADSRLLSRISWPEYDKEKVLEALGQNQDSFKRVCLQVVHADGKENHMEYIRDIKASCNLPLSIDLKADDIGTVRRLFHAGADVVGMPIDAANPIVYSDVKQGELASRMELINQAAGEFEGRISTHLMVGLGESEKDLIMIMRNMHRIKVTTALFAFTPIKGTPLENVKQPAIEKYRRIQVAKFLIESDLSPDFAFHDNGNIRGYGFSYEELKDKISPRAFMTTGCSGCNRPYYNERPGGSLYNYPYRPSLEEYEMALKDAWIG